jgi:hypothetical protein
VGKSFAALDEEVKQFIQAQSMSFVASAPLDPNGHVNLSPKGLDTFRILGPRTVAYLDFTGSGVETIAHLKENGRIVLMFCAFEGPPNILRLYGRGRAVELHEPEFPALQALSLSTRARVQSSLSNSLALRTRVDTEFLFLSMRESAPRWQPGQVKRGPKG